MHPLQLAPEGVFGSASVHEPAEVVGHEDRIGVCEGRVACTETLFQHVVGDERRRKGGHLGIGRDPYELEEVQLDDVYARQCVLLGGLEPAPRCR